MSRVRHDPGGWAEHTVEFTQEQRAAIEAALPPGDIEFSIPFLEHEVAKYHRVRKPAPHRDDVRQEIDRLGVSIAKTHKLLAALLPRADLAQESAEFREISERLALEISSEAKIADCALLLDCLQQELTKYKSDLRKEARPGQDFRTEHSVTSAVAFLWERHEGKRPGKSRRGRFFKLLEVLEPLVGERFNAKSEIEWYVAQRKRNKTKPE